MGIQSAYDKIDTVRAASTYGWERVIEEFTGHSMPVKGSCPLCGGNDRFFRKKDFAATGAVHCRQCFFEKNGDGFAFIMKATGKGFSHVVNEVGKLVGATPKTLSRSDKSNAANAGKNRPVSKSRNSTCIDQKWNDTIWRLASELKQKERLAGINKKGIEAVGGLAVYQGKSVIRVPIRNDGKHCNDLVLSLGAKFNFRGGDSSAKKIIGGKPRGWSGLIPPGEGEIPLVIKVEGYSDLLAMLSRDDLPEGTSVITNGFGCGEKPLVQDWFKRVKQFWVIGDCDEPGQKGAERFASMFAGFAPTKVLKLPFEVQESNGKDLRDWSGSFDELQAMADNSELAEACDGFRPERELTSEEIDKLTFEPAPYDPNEIAELVKLSINIRYFSGSFFVYELNRYVRQSSQNVNHLLRPDVKRIYRTIFYGLKETQESVQPQSVTTRVLNEVRDALASITMLPSSVTLNSWIGDDIGPRNAIALQNGILDLDRVGTDPDNALMSHTPDWFSTSCLPYDFDPNAESETLYKLIGHLGQEERRFLQQFAGYALEPTNERQHALILEGEGGTGKSSFLSVLQALVGIENTSAVSPEEFGRQFVISTMLGKLLNIAADVGQRKIPEGVLKRMISADRQSFDIKYQDSITTRPSAKHALSWNSRPAFYDSSNGLWRRFVLVAFQKVVGREKISGLDNPDWWQRSGELPGVLNWALAGLAQLKRNDGLGTLAASNGFEVPESSKVLVQNFRSESDFARTYLEENFKASPNQSDMLVANSIYKDYLAECEASGITDTINEQFFGKRVKSIFPNVERVRRTCELYGRKWRYSGLLELTEDDDVQGQELESIGADP